MMPSETMSHTRMVVMRQCGRKHYYRYVVKAYPRRPDSMQLVVGDVFHTWLEAFFVGWLFSGGPEWVPPSPPIWARDAWEENLHDDPTASVEVGNDAWLGFERVEVRDRFEAARLRAMVLAYFLRWRGTPGRPVAVEQEFAAPLESPETGETSDRFVRGGRIDLVWDTPEGDRWLYEHKTHAGPLKASDSYFSKLRLDAQCSHYTIGARALGHEVRGIVYDVTCKPQLEPLLATKEVKMTKATKTEPSRPYAGQRLADETPGEYGLRCFTEMVAHPEMYFHRREVVRLDDELVDIEENDWQQVKHLADNTSMNTDACFAYYTACEYHPVCSRGASIEDANLYEIRTKKR